MVNTEDENQFTDVYSGIVIQIYEAVTLTWDGTPGSVIPEILGFYVSETDNIYDKTLLLYELSGREKNVGLESGEWMEWTVIYHQRC